MASSNFVTACVYAPYDVSSAASRVARSLTESEAKT